MRLKISLLYIILSCVFVKLLCINHIVEGFKMDRIDVSGVTFEDNGSEIAVTNADVSGDYIYCLDGHITCNDGSPIEISDNSYNFGTTYEKECPDGSIPECIGNYYDKFSKDSLYLVEYKDDKLMNPMTISRNFDTNYSTFTAPYSYIPFEINEDNKTVKYYDPSKNEYNTNTCVLEGGSIYDCFIYDDVKIKSMIPSNINSQESADVNIKYNIENDYDEYVKQYETYDIETEPTNDYKEIYDIDLKN
jgi:hypothetical protein